MKPQSGVTLIELMIAVAVLGILAAIALPSYLDNVAKANANTAVGSLSYQKTLVADAFGINGTLGCMDSVGQAISNCSGSGVLAYTHKGVTATLTPAPVAEAQTLTWTCVLTPASTPKIQGCGL